MFLHIDKAEQIHCRGRPHQRRGRLGYQSLEFWNTMQRNQCVILLNALEIAPAEDEGVVQTLNCEVDEILSAIQLFLGGKQR